MWDPVFSMVWGKFEGKWWHNVILWENVTLAIQTSGSAMAEGPRDALVSRNSATTKHPI